MGNLPVLREVESSHASETVRTAARWAVDAIEARDAGDEQRSEPPDE